MTFVRSAMGRLRRNDRGVTALEFVLILPFFLAFVFMIFELGMMFAAQELLDNAARDVARSMRIGTYTGSSYASTVKAAICSNFTSNNFNLIQSCSTSLKLFGQPLSASQLPGNAYRAMRFYSTHARAR